MFQVCVCCCFKYPPIARFDFLLAQPEFANIGAKVNEAMRDIEKHNPPLAGVLPKTYNLFTSTLLKELLKKVSEIPATMDYDAFGRIYEYFLGEFAMSEGQGGGEFYSRRQILRETGMHRQTLKKILDHSEPPGYRQQQPRPRKKLGAFLERIKQILKDDQAMPRKQRHPAKRIWERLREDGFTGGNTVVRDAVRELTQKTQEVFVPLLHRPGEAQVDFGHALANVDGQLRKVAFFVMALPYSDATFVMAFEREGTETFWEGHVRAFDFFQGVPTRITYDNTKVAVSKILGKERRLTQGFLQLKSHYLFQHHFCRVARGNEKGVVEGQVKFTRLNYFVPVPLAGDMAGLNRHLQQRCQEDQARRLQGQTGVPSGCLSAELLNSWRSWMSSLILSLPQQPPS